MINYIIINGTNSNTINGLGINELPPISKPPLRVQTDTIDGRDGDITTNLGYGAYDKTITIGLFGTGYDINEVISFFNGEGTVVFSNEPDKYYKYKIIEQIDYEALLKFKSASITFHCQPFKYPLEETPIEIEYEYIEQDDVESATMNNTNGGTSLDISLKGNTSQYTTTGKNLLNVDEAFSWERYKLIELDNNISAGTYVVSWESASSSSTNTSSRLTFVYIDDTLEAQEFYYNTTSKNITLAKEVKQIRCYSNGDYSGSAGITATFNKLMISTSGGDYEPYTNGASPNPDYPQPINVVSGDNTIKVEGKNRFDRANATENKALAWSSGNNYNENQAIASDYIKVNTNEQYSINYWSAIFFYDKNKSYLGCLQTDGTTIEKSTGNTFKTFTIPNYNSIYYMRISTRSSSENNNKDMTKENLMLNKGTTLANYEPYQSQTYPINLPVENLFNKNSTPIYYDGGMQYEATDTGCKLTTSSASGFVLIDLGSISKYLNKTLTFSMSNTPNSLFKYIGFIACNSDGSSRTQIGGALGTSNNTLTTQIGSSYTQTNLALRLSIAEGTINTEYLLNNIQIEVGSKANHYTHYGTTPIELCKISTYQDYFYKTDKWYLHKEIGKVVLNGSENWKQYIFETTKIQYYLDYNTMTDRLHPSSVVNIMSNIAKGILMGDRTNYNNSVYTTSNGVGFRVDEILTIDNFKTYLGTNNAIVYYALATPTNIEITDSTLITQLDNIKNAISYEGQTNVSQENNDKPFLLDLIAMKKGTDEVVINNIGNTYSKPTIALEGTGITDIYLNNTEILQVDLTDTNTITIDTNNMEAYNPTDNTLANRKVVGNYNSMTLPSGNTTMKITGALEKATITDYSRWL